MKARLDDRILARNLREQGWSYNEIIARIPNLGKGTLNGWLKDIELTNEQKKRLLAKIKAGSERSRLKGAWRNREKRIQDTEKTIEMAKEEVAKMLLNPFAISGILLYWAEGDKTQERVGFTNSDPMMITLMMRWFREICRVPGDKFRICLSIMTLHDRNESEKFWSELTKVPLTQFNKIHIKPTPLKGKRNPSYMGTCRVIISDKQLFRKIYGWRMGFLEKFAVFAPIA